MTKPLIQIFREMEDAVTDFHIRLALGHEGIAKIWEKKMHPGIFELRMSMRRDERKERHVALLRMIGGLLQVLFWFFVIVGTLAVIGLLFFSPVIALIVVVCVVAGIVNVLYRRGRVE